jgi:hypothetical protein
VGPNWPEELGIHPTLQAAELPPLSNLGCILSVRKAPALRLWGEGTAAVSTQLWLQPPAWCF